jgi:uncharacterized protein YoxC
VKINKEDKYKGDFFYKYHKYFMENHSEKTDVFFKLVYDFGNMNKNSNCDGITNHIEYEQNTLEFTDQNKYIVILVQRRNAHDNTILKNVIVPNKTIQISQIDYTLTGIIALRGRAHYIYYEFNDNGNVIRVYDDKHPYIDLNENDIMNSLAEVDDKILMDNILMDNIYIDGLNHTEHINTHGCMFLYSRYPVDQYNPENKEYELNKLIAKKNELNKSLEKLNKSLKLYSDRDWDKRLAELIEIEREIERKIENNENLSLNENNYNSNGKNGKKNIDSAIEKVTHNIDYRDKTKKEIENIKKEIENIKKEIENIKKEIELLNNDT